MRLLSTAIAAYLALVAAPTIVVAAPQAMLLVANGDSIPFRCKGDQCLAEATSICLQEERPTPEAGTPYEPVDERRYGTGRRNGLHLVGYTASGDSMKVPLERMEIISERHHMAVRFIVPKVVLSEFDLDRMELQVTDNVVIAPVWQLGDPKPHLDSELEIVMGPIRATAESSLRRRGDTVASARLLGDLLNDLPRDRVSSIEERQQLYRDVVTKRTAKGGGSLSPDTLAQAQAAIDACAFIKDEEMWYRTFQTRISRYRNCIGYRHDKLIKDVNQTYWKAWKGAGS
jgi:hypothetical protein